MSETEVRMLPYGISSFEELRAQGMYCVDKTKYISRMEQAGNFLFLIRPRRFGKSVFLSMLKCYYDMSQQDRFDALFDGLWVKDHPTPLRGQYQVMHFDFSQVRSDFDHLAESFDSYCSIMLEAFAQKNARYYDSDFLQQVRRLSPHSSSQLTYIANQAHMKGIKLYLIIDEYDNFTNNVLNEKGEAVYHALTHATGFYRDVFKQYKANFSRVLMMGVSPVTLDDLTSGYNVALNITTLPQFNMMLGFSETEVRQMIGYYKDAGIIKADPEEMLAEMRPWYDNYCFAEESLERDPKMFNCDMVVYYLKSYLLTGKPPKDLLDANTRTDYKKLKRLMQLDGMGGEQRSIIQQVAAEGQIVASIKASFPAERIFDQDNFISLLYYYGMLTIVGTDLDSLVLGIPNNNVRKQYYEYLLTEYQLATGISSRNLGNAFRAMASEGNYRPALDLILEAYRDTSSVRNGIEGERNLQGFLCAYFSMTPLYLIAPEMELNHGYCDIFLMPDRQRYPGVKHSYILELKYLSKNDGPQWAERQWDQAIGQVRTYAADRKVALMTHDTTLHLLAMQVRGSELVRLEEVS